MAAMASSTLRPQALITHAGNQIEVSVHTAPRAVLRELRQVFGGRVSLDDAVVCLPTSQNTSIELVNWGDEAAGEKDRCLETFAAFGEAMRAALSGHWCDYIDPCSGLPRHEDCSTCVYDEVSGHQCLLKYHVSQAGGCKVLLHPKWGTACYPATIFTTAPAEAVLAALDAVAASETVLVTA
mmetsp:Transcript_25929/g.79739  ORF Transcript_25929/g.79739 Transcript_25929/m.79739 type:complete len:182 (+) Transcript_25929:519-1064(+)